jgi:hypothetical protein
MDRVTDAEELHVWEPVDFVLEPDAAVSDVCNSRLDEDLVVKAG